MSSIIKGIVCHEANASKRLASDRRIQSSDDKPATDKIRQQMYELEFCLQQTQAAIDKSQQLIKQADKTIDEIKAILNGL